MRRQSVCGGAAAGLRWRAVAWWGAVVLGHLVTRGSAGLLDTNPGLAYNFYGTSCPSAEATVKTITWQMVAANPALAGRLLRLHFHDCFVQARSKGKQNRKGLLQSMHVSATRPVSSAPVLALLLLLLLVGSASLAIGAMAGHVLGGKTDSPAAANSLETDGIARFAVDEHNKRENALLEFVRVVVAKEQVVAGTVHHLTLEALEAGRKKVYEAKVWVKPWLHFKELQEFRHTGDATSFTTSDLGAKRGEPEAGWRDVSVHDPVVKDAADHAVKTIQQRSNSLFPYELLEIIHAKAEVVEDFAKFDILLKLKRGTKEEKMKAEVHKNLEGTFVLNQMQPEHDESSSQ